nr:hypothetical protein [Tanacetum cinerariifolium]
MMASFFQMNTAFTSGLGPLPSNTIAYPKGELKSITTRSGLVLYGPFVPMPPPFINPEEDERVEETLTDPNLAEFTIKVPPPLVQKPKPPSQRNFVMHQKDPLHPNILYPSRMHKQKQQEKDESSPPHNINPSSGSTTSSSSSNHLLDEFADELALITFPPGNDDLLFDIESDLREIEYLLNHDPNKELDSILDDSIYESNLADPNVNLFDTILEMFTDEHALDYSSLPLYDEYEDDLFEFDSDIDDAYNDPFDSKGEKIIESKLLIDELDLPRSSDFLPFPEYDSFLFEHFSKVDALPLTNNKDKLFNLAISHASLILEDFDPPLYELPFHKEVLGSETLLSFSSKNEENFSNPGFSLLKKVILLFSRNYLIRAMKLSKSLKLLKAQWRFFFALLERTSYLGCSMSPFLSLMNKSIRGLEIEYLLNHDPTKEMDYILEDSIDESNHADPNNDLFDTILEMFTDEHALDYSSPPLYDDFDDDLVEFESDNDDAYNDPCDSKEDKIKESKLLIDELDLPRSSDFIPSPRV